MFHSIAICHEVAEKMKNPSDVSNTVVEAIKHDAFFGEGWPRESFGEGFAGIAVFYAVMDTVFPEAGWDKIAHQYIKLTADDLEQNGYKNYSLFSGICGLCYAIHLSAYRGARYKKILGKLEGLLISETERSFLSMADHYLENNLDLPPSFYSLTNGISGVLAYLLLRKEDSRMHQLTVQCLSKLVLLLNRQKDSNPNWYIPPEHQIGEESLKYPQGSFLLNMPFGITGCLASLSLASWEGFDVPGLKETILKIAYWIKDQTKISEDKFYWPNTCPLVPLENENSYELTRDTWWYGIPAVARSLFLASKAVKDVSLGKFAERAFLSMFQKDPSEWNMMGTSFMHGRAGVLATVYRMAQDTQNPLLWKQVNLLEEDLKKFYRPLTPFGFQAVDVTETGEYRWIDDPGIFSGAAGIALSLLLVQNRPSQNWDRAFLIV